jgi:hypothetical protein
MLISIPTTNFLLLPPTPTAISPILKPGPRPGQPLSLLFRQTADNVLFLKRKLKIPDNLGPLGPHTSWRCSGPTPHKHDRHAPLPRVPPNHRESHAISYHWQRQAAKTTAIDTWSTRWRNSDRPSQAYVALPVPPTGKPSPVIQCSECCDRAVFATLIRFITGHTVIGSYTEKFRPDPPTNCPRGAPCSNRRTRYLLPTLRQGPA